MMDCSNTENCQCGLNRRNAHLRQADSNKLEAVFDFGVHLITGGAESSGRPDAGPAGGNGKVSESKEKTRLER